MSNKLTVRLSHHRTYGSRIRRFVVHHFNRSFHRLKLSPTFILGYMVAGKLSVMPPCSQFNFKEDNVQPFLRILIEVLWPWLTSWQYMQPGSPGVRVPSFPSQRDRFAGCLPYLLNEPSPVGVLDIAMMCLLIRFIKPLIRFCLAYPLGAVRHDQIFPENVRDSFGIAIPFGADLQLPATSSDGSEQALRLVGAQRKSRYCGANGSPLLSGEHKGLSP